MAQGTLPLYFRVSPEVLGPLGLEQLHDPALAVLELIKNSWDADATRVSVAVTTQGCSREVTVHDNGHGMSEADFIDYWLVIGASHKRRANRTAGGRPLIGEKGLGRLATFALGNTVTIESATESNTGFLASINWQQLRTAESLEQYPVQIKPATRERGTKITAGDLTCEWQRGHANFLVTHAEFLTSVPDEQFEMSFSVNGVEERLASRRIPYPN